MDGIVQGVAKSWTQLSDFHFTLVIKFNIRTEEHRNVSLMRKYDSEHLSNSNLNQDKKTQPPLRDPPNLLSITTSPTPANCHPDLYSNHFPACLYIFPFCVSIPNQFCLFCLFWTFI